MEQMAPFLMRLPEDMNVNDIFTSIAEIKISHSNFRSICDRFNYMKVETKRTDGNIITNFFSSFLAGKSSEKMSASTNQKSPSHLPIYLSKL